MPFALVTIGLILIVAGARDTYSQLGQQITHDFTGDGNFTWWLVSIGSVGALGYIEDFKPFSRAFMALIIIAMFLSNKGFFQQFTDALKAGPVPPTARPTETSVQAVHPASPSVNPATLAEGVGIAHAPAGAGTGNAADAGAFIGAGILGIFTGPLGALASIFVPKPAY